MGEHKRRKKRPFSSYGKKSKFKFATAVVVLCIIAVAAVDVVQRSKTSPLLNFVPSRTKGPSEAPLQILEFADFQCSHCAKGLQMIRNYMEQYPDGIRLSMKYFPLGGLNSRISAIYAECAARQDKFWAFHDILFDRQAQWVTLRNIKPYFRQVALEAGLEANELELCAQQQDVQALVTEERLLGESHSVKSTPTYFVNNELVVGVENLRKLLEDFFESKRQDFL